MTALQGSPRFTGFIRRLVEEGVISAEDMRSALAHAKQEKIDIVAELINQQQLSPTVIAETISVEFGEPLFDISAYDPAQILRDIIDEKLITKHRILPIFKNSSILYIAISNPTNIEAIDAVRFSTKLNIETIIVEHNKLEKLIEQNFTEESTFEFDEDFDLDVDFDSSDPSKEEDEKDKGEEEAPIVKYINKLLIDAIRMGASDLHFEPYEKIYRVRYRVDGVLRQIATPPLQLATRLSSRLKVMSQMDISEKRVPQDGRIKLKLSKNKAIDFRVNSLPTLFGEKLVLRILDPSSAMLGIDALGYEPEQKELFMQALDKPQGMLLITGPTGSGKTVSLYTGLNILNREDTNISTAEDPVEINLQGINQVNVNNKVGLTFSAALKSFLRQDPDIVMVGEIRDLETAEIAIKAAQTGHMVMSTLHTNSAPETLTRLRNMGVPSFNIATSVNLVIAQRLARRLCSQCKKPADIPQQSLLEMGFTEADLQQPEFQIYEPVGCNECREGYKGRVGVYEVMKVTPEISRIIMEDGNALEIADASARAGFNNLRRSGLIKVMQGVTSLQEVNRVTSE
ncbi:MULTISPECIES: type IV-A pilus assembly ATPase PilB [Acinetobacter]|uniref:Type IV-A pilus assembly ATPase PilB n=1 Tax=Acinetobacter pseudolwoffii TaxID=2053287 RepID=A0A2H9YRE2_9GAMM|nr:MULTISPECIES: type IV-A pilus assembly ATPase PilB [Acinetobacter]ENW25958.1 type IV-A pilus assembly ATPase PilB [Acinetobacter lwoffii NCTC 5866 = CIP 64.10 = NIPH 512]MCP0912602.1 type IV-A pilus assembly ATPase PilB [Acinetobacter pseudolwoffii]MDM1323422.1 type IV-A pilus assembly ATPase PilB [Acinetobacter pseudolwoffii]MDM1335365.1 type IV-A pilus assembly ATPase PilB [Acinetobacter pseudolwoffii]MDM1341284.1 type IV-A pilus assembly ATPase PilB [Acinetobacter pseudolwoffii]